MTTKQIKVWECDFEGCGVKTFVEHDLGHGVVSPPEQSVPHDWVQTQTRWATNLYCAKHVVIVATVPQTDDPVLLEEQRKIVWDLLKPRSIQTITVELPSARPLSDTSTAL